MGLKQVNRAKIIREVAEELELPYSITRAVIDEIFHQVSEFLKNPQNQNKPAVFLRKFGTFEPILRKIVKKAYNTEEDRDKWIDWKNIVGDYYNLKNKKYKVKNKNEQEESKRIDNSESGDIREE
jgi:nucleoid DNA-binding protein